MITAYYDLQTSPPTFDVVGFLMAVERTRLQRGENKVSINILPGPVNGFRRDRYWPFTADERKKTLHQIVVPMMRMLPSVSEVTVRHDRPVKPEPWSIGFNCRLYGTRLFVDCMRDGIRPLRPPEDVKRDPLLVTITLREAEHWPARNSNVPEWVAAAKEIERRGYRVVIVRDTLRAGEPIEGLPTDRAAAWDLIARAQLYRSAVCNLSVNNGPAWFGMSLDAPVLILKPAVDGLIRTCSADFFRQCGVPIGGQIPGAPDYQRIVWAEDTAAAVVDAFDAFISGEKQRSAA